MVRVSALALGLILALLSIFSAISFLIFNPLDKEFTSCFLFEEKPALTILKNKSEFIFFCQFFGTIFIIAESTFD